MATNLPKGIGKAFHGVTLLPKPTPVIGDNAIKARLLSDDTSRSTAAF
jgi:hypothetical protein